jgi:hypothetical protein
MLISGTVLVSAVLFSTVTELISNSLFAVRTKPGGTKY